jgi:hypothetical protein
MGFSRVDANSETRPEGRNCLLAYGFDEAQQGALRKLLIQAGIEELVPVTDEGTGLLLAELLADSPQNKAMSPLPASPVAVFHSVSDAGLNRFLTLFRASGLPRPLFAVVTPTSIQWRFGDLVSELMRERRAMEKENNT